MQAQHEEKKISHSEVHKTKERGEVEARPRVSVSSSRYLPQPENGNKWDLSPYVLELDMRRTSI